MRSRQTDIEKSDRLIKAVEQVPEGIVLTDSEGNIQYANRAWSMMIGMDGKEASQNNIFELCISTDSQLKDGWREQILKDGRCYTEITHTKKDGTTFLAFMRAFVVKDDVGNPRGINFFIHDITELGDLRKAFHSIRGNFDNIVQSSIEGVLVVDEEGVILFANEAAEQLFGKKKEMLEGECLGIPLTPGERTETNIIRRHGELAVVELSETKTEWEGEPAHLILLYDITERKQAEKDLAQKVSELERLNQELKVTQAELIQAGKLTAMGQMAAEIAHEINSPLGAIRLNVDSAVDDIESGAFSRNDLKESLHAISSAVVKVSEAIRNLRVFSRRSDESASRLNIHEPLRNVIDMLGALFEKHDVVVKEEYCGGDLMMWGNRNEIEQVFTNLLLNARDALKDKPAGQKTISIRTVPMEEGSFRVEVEDNGCGMDPDVKERIFDAYFTTKNEEDGVGLGLAIVKRIIDEHEGGIEIRSELGKGTKFTLTFPNDRRKESRRKGIS